MCHYVKTMTFTILYLSVSLNLGFFFSVFSAKLNRLKQAKNEVDEEVAKYRAHMEKEFQKTISEVIKTHKPFY